MDTRLGLRAGAAAAVAVSLLGSAPGATAGAFATPDAVVNRETVRVDLSAEGEKKVARLYSQLVVDGNGTVRVADPTATEDLRDLDGFSVPSTQDGKAVWDIDVEGRAVRRTLSTYTKDLPVTIGVTYTLDGKQVDPGDVVGKSGTLRATYRVENVTGTPTAVTYKNGKGETITETVDVPVPLVGSFRTTLPGRFTQVDAAKADVVGDGRGNTTVQWSLVLFAPLGDPVFEFGWTAQVEDGITPRADITILPVLPTKKFSVGAYESGAAQATELTDGAGQIDANVLKLRDGAAELLDGLGLLAAGATELQEGLAGEAAPGAGQIAGGLDLAADGGGDLVDGAGQLSAGLSDANEGGQLLLDGSEELAAGAGLVAGGAGELEAGLALIAGGLAQLAAVDGLPAAKAGAIALQSGVTALLAGIGSAATPGTILNGLAQISGGLDALGSNTTGLPAAKGGVDQVNAGLATAKTSLQGLQAAVSGSVAEIQGALALLGCPGSLNPVCPLLDSALSSSHGLSTVTLPGLAALESGTGDAIAGLTTVSTGLGTAIAGVTALSAGAAQVTAGVNAVKLGLDNPGGLGIKQGLDQLVAGLTTAVAGVTALNAGAADAYAGAGDLADGAEQVAAGAGELSAGALELADGLDQLDAGGSELAAGAGDLLDGLDQLKAGAHELSSGLGDAADGSGQIADGLGSAEDGGQQITDGAAQLSKEGTSVLVEKGNATAAAAAKTYATIQQLDVRAAASGMPFGAPEGGTGTAAYVMTLAAADGQAVEDRGRLLLAVGLIVAACAAGSLLRRRAVSW